MGVPLPLPTPNLLTFYTPAQIASGQPRLLLPTWNARHCHAFLKILVSGRCLEADDRGMDGKNGFIGASHQNIKICGRGTPSAHIEVKGCKEPEEYSESARALQVYCTALCG